MTPLGLVLGAALLASPVGVHVDDPFLPLERCVTAMGKVLYDGAFSLEGQCIASDTDMIQTWGERQTFLDYVISTRPSNNNSSPEDIQVCRNQWTDTWDLIFGRAKGDLPMPEAITHRNSQVDLGGLEPFHAEIVARAKIDMQSTHIPNELGWPKPGEEERCSNAARFMPMERMDNIEFIKRYKLHDLVAAGSLNTDVAWAIWYMTQHADADIAFQEVGLEAFKTAQQHGFPKRLVKSLEGRVEWAKSQPWNQ